MIICILYGSFLNWTVAIFHYCSCLRVVASDFWVQPRQRLDDGWKGSLHMYEDVFSFFELRDDCS